MQRVMLWFQLQVPEITKCDNSNFVSAAHRILDGRRLVKHIFNRCPLNSSARVAPECRKRPDGKAVAGGCLGGARRRNICAPHPILDGIRLGNHPFYRCPLKDSSARVAPECRKRPRTARLSPAAASAEPADEIYALRIRFLMAYG